MKRNCIYIILMVLLFLFLYWLNKDAPIRYRWTPTFSTKDKQPYGTYVFDKILKASWEKGYTQSYRSIMDLEREEILDNYNLLIVANSFKTYKEELETLLSYISRGGNVLIVSDNFSHEIEDTLNISAFINVFSYLSLIDLSKEQQPPSRQLRLSSPAAKGKTYTFPAAFCSMYIKEIDYDDSDEYENNKWIDSTFRISETMNDEMVSLRFRLGKGNLILACNPLVYTNYGILKDSISEYIRYHLSYLQDRPLMRTEYYQFGSQGNREQSPFRYVLSERALRWAFYITLTSILVFMLFTAKRKQKAIPVIQSPANRMLAFIRAIAGLYLLKNNNADIILKKQVYWTEKMKRKYEIDLINEPHDWHLYLRIASKTGRPVDEIRRLLINLQAIDKNSLIPDNEMIQLITEMNDLSNKNE
jgi:hypothetical protein